MRSPMTPNRHRIQRQVMELTVGDARAAPGIQEQLARACREPLLKGMEQVFDAVASAHELLRLDRVEIDVGRIEGADWAPEFERRLLAELGRQLEGRAAEAQRQRSAQASEEGGGEFEAFMFFLRHGRLPWWRRAPDADWPPLFEAADARRIEAVRSLFEEEPRILPRLIDALDDARLETLVAGVGAARDCTAALRELLPADSPAAYQRWRQAFWSAVLGWSLARGDAVSGAALVQSLLADRCRLAMEQSRHRSDVMSASTGEASPPVIRPVTTSALPAPWREWCEAALQDMGQGASIAPAASRPVPAAPGPGAPRREAPGRKVEPAMGEAVYLPCVGILLLHPFLAALFDDRGLLDRGCFVDEGARQRGAQLLGHLATGLARTPEYELGFAKLLTGIALDSPLESLWLEEQDIAACAELLDAVLGHWTALRSSSAAWLRSQFFLREGKLEAVEGGYRVTVERRAQDVLLARLPWGFGVISLPWLNDRIFVQWLD